MKFIVIHEIVDRIEEGGYVSRNERWTWEVRWSDDGFAFGPLLSESQRYFSTLDQALDSAREISKESDFTEETTGDCFSKAVVRWEKT